MQLKSLIPFRNPLNLHSKKFRKDTFSFRRLARFAGFGAIGLFILMTLLFAVYSKDLPTPGKIKKSFSPESTRIMDREGNLLFDVHGDERRFILKQEEIPQSIKNATIATEDKDFYKHFGFDMRGLVRGVILKPLSGEGFQGGSTITQQFVKNALLSPKRTVTRKVKELILAIEMEMMFSKEQILTFYLNEIPYGSNAYGIEAAAKTYFNKSAKDLTLSEAALLAALPQAPTRLSPYGQRRDELLHRKNFVLDKMAEQGYITKEERDQAKGQELTFVPRREQIGAPHFSLWVRELLVDEFGEREVLEGGMKVTTTLDPKVQESAVKAVSANVDRIKGFGATNAAMAAVDPKTGQVLAMVGSIDYFDVENEGNFNVAVAERQPGSSFKPFAYATAFKNKYNPAYTLWDVPTDFGNYTPQNYDGRTRGPITMRGALANSLNIPAVKTLALAGIDNVIDQAHAMGITTLNDRSRYGLSLVLGGGEVKPIDMASAFGVFGANGIRNPMTPFLKVEDRNGKVLKEYKQEEKRVLDDNVAYEISHILSDNGARAPVFGAGGPLAFTNRAVAAKTGTTQSYRDAWTVGYTPSLAAAVWVGRNDNTPMENRADGSVVAAPIFRRFMDTALEGKPNEPFTRPSSIKEVAVDRLSNKLPGSFRNEIITDIFAPWQIPDDLDDVHVKILVDTVTGKRATDSCPTNRALVEERFFVEIHSEFPNRPNWEKPVQDWAAANGLNAAPPTETCSALDPSNNSSVGFLTPQKDTVLTGPFQIAVDVTGGFNVQKVEFFIDNISIGTVGGKPFAITYDAESISAGTHTLLAVATDPDNRSSSAQLSVRTQKAGTLRLTNIQVASGNAGSVTITWQTNLPSDSKLEYGPNVEYGSTARDSALVTSHSVPLTALTSSVLYHFRVTSALAGGESARSADFVFTAP